MSINSNTMHRLTRRAREDEQTCEDVINRLLDDTIITVELTEVIEQSLDQFQDVPSITVNHLPTHERPEEIVISLYTGEANSYEEYLDLYSPDHQIVIDRDDETFTVPFHVKAYFEGPVTWDSTENTTIHLPEGVFGVEPVNLDDGIAYLQNKLENPDQWSADNSQTLDNIRNYTEVKN